MLCVREMVSRHNADPPPGAGIDTGVAHPARVYDYWLGGKDNFAADRQAAEAVIAVRPSIIRDIRENRNFDGPDLVEPGVVQAHQWRPDPGSSVAGRISAWAGVARKP